MSNVHLRLLGTLQIVVNDEPVQIVRRKSVALFAVLAISRSQQSRDKLATLLWPDLERSRSRAVLRTTLSELNQTALANCLDIQRETIALNHDCNIWVDVHQFEALADADDTDDATQLEEAVKLYRGDLLTGFTLSDSPDFDDWLARQTERLRAQMIESLEILTEQFRQQQDYNKAIHYARRWLALDELEEKVHLRLMQLYIENGQRTAAMHQYEMCLRLLQEELGITPRDSITEMYERIKNDRESLYFQAMPQSTGLAPPLPALIVGRETALNELRQRLRDLDESGNPGQTTTVIQGWPGVGKSTLVAMVAHDPTITDLFPDGILWTSLGENPNLLSKLQAWIQSLGLQSDAQATIEDLSLQLTAYLREKQMLLIVDDIWEIEHAMPFKVGGRDATTLATTRFPDLANQLATTPSDVYRLPILSTDAGLQLLERLAPDVVHQHEADARQLVDDLEGLPLALQVAGRLLHAEAQLGWGIHELMEEIREGTKLLEAQAPPDRIDLAEATAPTVAILIQKSVDRLEEQMQAYFAMLGVFAPKPATFDLPAMAAVWDIDDAKPQARVLVERGLLEPIGGGRFQMHALLVMYAKSFFDV